MTTELKPITLRSALAIVALGVVLTLLPLLLGGCAPVQRHQRGGGSSQSLGDARPAPVIAPYQAMQQPENPEGQSLQELTRTVTTTHADGSVTTTREVARTVIGGSQRLADILKEYAKGEYMRRIALALIMGLIAWLLRKEWPLVAGVLGIGALVVAFFGPGWALAFAGAGAGIYVTYYIVSARIGRVI